MEEEDKRATDEADVEGGLDAGEIPGLVDAVVRVEVGTAEIWCAKLVGVIEQGIAEENQEEEFDQAEGFAGHLGKS